MLPNIPSFVIPRPFGENGSIAVIPDDKPAPGRASFKEGFPQETQQPLARGGVAPSRIDFNGVLNMLSAFTFWQQSGGLWVYRTDLNYNAPSVVFYGGSLWYCVAQNGPDTVTPGVVTPGTNEAYWVDFFSWLSGGSGGSAGGIWTPLGTVITYYGTVAPDGYLACDGASFSATDYPKLYAHLGNINTTPDMRGLFVRGYDPTGARDPDGTTRLIGSVQQDELKAHKHDIPCLNEIAYGSSNIPSDANGPLVMHETSLTGGPETRPKNIVLMYCIKHD